MSAGMGLAVVRREANRLAPSQGASFAGTREGAARRSARLDKEVPCRARRTLNHGVPFSDSIMSFRHDRPFPIGCHQDSALVLQP